jgi:hypothetical protein
MYFEHWEDDLEARWQTFKAGIEEAIASAEPVVRIDDSEVGEVFTGSDFGCGPSLRCPVCGAGWLHAQSAHARLGGDEGGDGYRGVEARGRTDERRDALCIGVEGECGHNFNIIFQQHKGNEFIRVEIMAKDATERRQRQRQQQNKVRMSIKIPAPR